MYKIKILKEYKRQYKKLSSADKELTDDVV